MNIKHEVETLMGRVEALEQRVERLENIVDSNEDWGDKQPSSEPARVRRDQIKVIENSTPIYDLDDGIEYCLGPEYGNIWNRIISHSPCGCARVVQVGVGDEVHNQEGKFVPPFIRFEKAVADLGEKP